MSTDTRTEHLIALVEDGASLAEAGRAHGISRERVRQILKGEGITATALPVGREPAPSAPVRHLTPSDLRDELDRFELALRAGGLREATVHHYLTASSRFVRWLAGDYVPQPRAAERSSGVGRSRP